MGAWWRHRPIVRLDAHAWLAQVPVVLVATSCLCVMVLEIGTHSDISIHYARLNKIAFNLVALS